MEDRTCELIVVDDLYFVVRTACGQSWPGMRRTNDVSIIVNRAMDHMDTCQICKAAKGTATT